MASLKIECDDRECRHDKYCIFTSITGKFQVCPKLRIMPENYSYFRGFGDVFKEYPDLLPDYPENTGEAPRP